MSRSTTTGPTARCPVCKELVRWLASHIREEHGPGDFGLPP